jgi:hypothetical protein
MAIEAFYETSTDKADVGFPVIYQVFKDGDQEMGRYIVNFSDLPPGMGASYLADFKAYLTNLVSTIPESDNIDASERSILIRLGSSISFLESYIPPNFEEFAEESSE